MDSSSVIKIYNILMKQKCEKTSEEIAIGIKQLNTEKKKILRELIKHNPHFDELPFEKVFDKESQPIGVKLCLNNTHHEIKQLMAAFIQMTNQYKQK